MKFILFGYGKMGKAVEEIALSRGHEVIARLTSQAKIPESLFTEADAALDFSRPEAVLDHLKIALRHSLPLVMGTTGWDDQFPLVTDLVQKQDGSFLYAPNFSLGMALFKTLIAQAAQLLGPWKRYDVALSEAHHRQKVDSPSGTAISLARALQEQLPSQQAPVPISSQRVGHETGTHEVLFDSEEDTLTFTHRARSRNGFALGAVLAAEWLPGRPGFHTFEEVLGIAPKSPSVYNEPFHRETP